jgi:hypothetical protein
MRRRKAYAAISGVELRSAEAQIVERNLQNVSSKLIHVGSNFSPCSVVSFLIEKMNKMHVMSNVFDLFNSTITQSSK